MMAFPESHIVLHNRVAARVGVLVAQPLKDPLSRVPLLLAARLIPFQDLIDDSDPGAQFGSAHWLLSLIAGWHCVSQHLPHCFARQPELPGRLAFAHLVDHHRSPDARIQLHCVHLSGVPQNITLWECSMEPVSWWSTFGPPATSLTRRLLVYFRSGAYRSFKRTSSSIRTISFRLSTRCCAVSRPKTRR